MLTSLDENDLKQSGVGGTPHDHVMRLAELAHTAGLDGIVCSGQEVGQVRKQWKDGFFVVPGLRPAGSLTGDQKAHRHPRDRPATMAQAFSSLAARSVAPKTQRRRHARSKRRSRLN